LLLNVKDATLPGTADTLNLDLRGTSATHRATIAGVEIFNVDVSNAATAETLGLVATSGTTVNLTNTGASSFSTGTLGSSFTTVNLSAVTGAGINTVIMTAANTAGASVTGSKNADTITTTAGLDIISSGVGNDNITALAGADRIDVGTGTDTVFYTVAAQTTSLATAATLVSGTTDISATVDRITGMGVGDIINLVTLSNSYTGAVGTTIAGAAGTTVSITRGDYSLATGIWTTSTTGADSILAFDSDFGGAGTIVDFSILIGFTGVASTVAAGVITLG